MKHCPNPDCRGRVRDGRVAEFADTIESCLDCDARLVPGPALPDAEEPALEFHALETVFVSTGRVTARVVAGLLEASGIPVYVKGEMLAGAIGELPATVDQLEVQVPSERADRAREIVDRYERGLLDLDAGHSVDLDLDGEAEGRDA